MSHIKLHKIFSYGLLGGVLLLTACSNDSRSDSISDKKTVKSPTTQSQRLHIAAAANLSGILPDIIESYKKEASLADGYSDSHFYDYSIEVTYASSGKLYAQISAGAPYDLFLSANQSYPYKLASASVNAEQQHQPFTYARGQLALYNGSKQNHLSHNELDNGLKDDLDNDLKSGLDNDKPLDINTFNRLIEAYPNTKLTIANPELAPYGASAKAFLNHQNLYKKLIAEKRLVQAENIGQAFQYVHAGSVDYGLVAQSQLIASGISDSQYRTLSVNEYPAILQDGLVITDNDNAKDFAQFIQSDVAQQKFQQAGYLPISQPKE